MTAELDFDNIHWELDDNGDYMPRETPLPINYPAEDNVLLGTIFGYADQYEGTLIGGSDSIDPATLTGITAGDGLVTVGVELNTSENTAYLVWRGEDGAWTSPSESYKASENGSIDIPCTNGHKVYVAALSKVGYVYSMPSNIVAAMPYVAGTLPVEVAIRKLLEADITVYNAIGTRIFPGLAPQSESYPLIVYTRVSGDHSHSLDAATGLATVRMQIDAYSELYETVKSLAESIRKAIHVYSGTVTAASGSVTISSCRMSAEYDSYEPPENGRGKGIHRVIQEYEILYQESI